MKGHIQDFTCVSLVGGGAGILQGVTEKGGEKGINLDLWREGKDPNPGEEELDVEDGKVCCKKF